MSEQASEDELAKIIDTKNVAMHEAVWGDLHIEHSVFKERFNATPLLKGLLDNRILVHVGYYHRRADARDL